LKELVPVYVIALFTAVASLIEWISVESLITSKIAIYILIGIACLVTLYFEVRRYDNQYKFQIIITMINAGLWLFSINLHILDFPILIEFWIRFITAIWTALVPFIF
jgi:hypothetical protein